MGPLPLKVKEGKKRGRPSHTFFPGTKKGRLKWSITIRGKEKASRKKNVKYKVKRDRMCKGGRKLSPGKREPSTKKRK